jgi:hypothetical protein
MCYGGVDVEMEAVRAFARMASIPSFSIISRRFYQFVFLCEPGVTGLVRVGVPRTQTEMGETGWRPTNSREDGPQIADPTSGDHMRSAAQIQASKINGRRSRGPVTASGKKRVLFNALKTGLRAKALILPGESADDFASLLEDLVDGLQPSNSMEYRLVHQIARADWMNQRAERAQFEHLKAHIDGIGDREDLDVQADIEKLFLHPAGPYQLYGITRPAVDEPLTSAALKSDDPNRSVAALKRLEGSAKGCQSLLGHWRAGLTRVQDGAELQAHDRHKIIRMLGREVVHAVEDRRIAVIFLASFALKPREKAFPYDDLKSDLNAPEVAAFVERVLRQWGRILDTADAPAAREALVDLISRNIERLEAKLEVHLQHADERAASIKAMKAWDASPEGERLARYELATSRRAERLRAAYFKLRKETLDTAEAEDAEEEPESMVAAEAASVAEANLTNEPKTGDDVPQDESLAEVAACSDVLKQAIFELSQMREMGIAGLVPPVAGGVKVPAAVEQAILGGGPLLRPIK